MNRIIIFIFAVLFLSSGCNSTNSLDPDATYLRISNISQKAFQSVYVSYPGVETTFEDIGSGNSSSYKKVTQVYRYGYIKIQSGDEEYILQPIDFVGEEPLENGRYTYKLGLDGESVTLNFVRK